MLERVIICILLSFPINPMQIHIEENNISIDMVSQQVSPQKIKEGEKKQEEQPPKRYETVSETEEENAPRTLSGRKKAAIIALITSISGIIGGIITLIVELNKQNNQQQ